MKEKSTARLRCRPGDLARVINSPNAALVGRTVEVVQLHCDGRWECVLEGGAVIGLADDGLGLLLTRDWLFPDSLLEPRRVRGPATLTAFAESFAL
ncbi:hypothetical protein WS72_11535 [Burkholderia savannae]|uniref:DUF2917 family protein n=2 Tax=Burkholderia TaxID=32008 RepID=A0ABR5TEK2_9BURK|nr:hypothetical protein WS72_11535 [Burkholderia savannae]KWZ46451.1 hypothetical protein WS73_20660 [Burkholderia savannae]